MMKIAAKFLKIMSILLIGAFSLYGIYCSMRDLEKFFRPGTEQSSNRKPLDLVFIPVDDEVESERQAFANPLADLPDGWGVMRVLKDPNNPSLGWGKWIPVPPPKPRPWVPRPYASATRRNANPGLANNESTCPRSSEPLVAPNTSPYSNYPRGYREREEASRMKWRREEERKHELELARRQKPVIIVQPR